MESETRKPRPCGSTWPGWRLVRAISGLLSLVEEPPEGALHQLVQRQVFPRREPLDPVMQLGRQPDDEGDFTLVLGLPCARHSTIMISLWRRRCKRNAGYIPGYIPGKNGKPSGLGQTNGLALTRWED